jgi:DNA-binding NtrC family response regulator
VLTDRARVELDIPPIAAVEPGFENAVEEGRLRRDLYDRLSLIRIELPPMRQRREDIPFLANHFLKEICRANGAPLKDPDPLGGYPARLSPWRGNAPELRGITGTPGPADPRTARFGWKTCWRKCGWTAAK